jgi:hypothetical protein
MSEIESELDRVAEIEDSRAKLAEAERAARKHPDEPRAHLIVCEALRQNGRGAEALGHAERAFSLAPDEPIVMANLGLARVDADRSERGVPLIEAAVRREPVFAHVLASALLVLGRTADAKDAIDVAAGALGVDLETYAGPACFERDRIRTLDLAARLDLTMARTWKQVEEGRWIPVTREGVEAMERELARIDATGPMPPEIAAHAQQLRSILTEARSRRFVGRPWIGVLGGGVGAVQTVAGFDAMQKDLAAFPILLFGLLYVGSAVLYFVKGRAPVWQINADVQAGATNPVDWMFDKINRLGNSRFANENWWVSLVTMFVTWSIVVVLAMLLPVSAAYLAWRYREPPKADSPQEMRRAA